MATKKNILTILLIWLQMPNDDYRVYWTGGNKYNVMVENGAENSYRTLARTTLESKWIITVEITFCLHNWIIIIIFINK